MSGTLGERIAQRAKRHASPLERMGDTGPAQTAIFAVNSKAPQIYLPEPMPFRLKSLPDGPS
jgi:hypothetical protein